LAYADTRVLCAFDPAGKSGDYYKMMQDLGVEAQTWGTTLDIRAYTDEETAAKDYDAGHCDAVLATGVRLQRFNRFSSTIEAIGAAPTYTILKQAIESLNKYESAAARFKSGDHETAGILPVGAVYLFLRDRNDRHGARARRQAHRDDGLRQGGARDGRSRRRRDGACGPRLDRAEVQQRRRRRRVRVGARVQAVRALARDRHEGRHREAAARPGDAPALDPNRRSSGRTSARSRACSSPESSTRRSRS
jgi:hypothetical protein